MSKATRVRIADAGDSIRRREVFIAGNGSLSGRHVSHTLSKGRAPDHVTAGIRAALSASDAPLYIVLSYGTPIAWAAPGQPLTVPAVRYSVMTSRHQSIARRADA